MDIIWSKKAGETFQRNIDYLKENWTEVEVKKFITRVFTYLETISEEPLISRKTYKTKNTHIGFIIPHISVVYRIKPKKEILEIVTFIDNRQSSKKKKRFL
ncbi:type II toxin-antitoxin system RelE/ParE family toxin [Pedobacter psychrodurus]|uniref:Type II toxin-antitoxin system RelE/ParE family toxin n=1 Tax=Pedobacter psychrodurus TaxID=2530456 RepID=A0A4R0PRD3_9SPHI|nr:type II toxin-antitoxin system RelE/ParE family toxin [Pedobacter psychrodurus]TCD21095.1 type II toxin-antitoxin system RelE/ParE family toxin [Pedobacter psychrodurus]